MEEVSFLSGSASAEALKAHDAEESQYLRTRRTKMSVEEFTNLALLGRGGFGDVYLCRKNDTGEIVALKTMDKSRFTSTNQIQRVMKEREILSGIVSPWLVQLKYSFSSATQLFMAMVRLSLFVVLRNKIYHLLV
jgi:protein-serine/threonine kinase